MQPVHYQEVYPNYYDPIGSPKAFYIPLQQYPGLSNGNPGETHGWVWSWAPAAASPPSAYYNPPMMKQVVPSPSYYHHPTAPTMAPTMAPNYSPGYYSPPGYDNRMSYFTYPATIPPQPSYCYYPEQQQQQYYYQPDFDEAEVDEAEAHQNNQPSSSSTDSRYSTVCKNDSALPVIDEECGDQTADADENHVENGLTEDQKNKNEAKSNKVQNHDGESSIDLTIKLQKLLNVETKSNNESRGGESSGSSSSCSGTTVDQSTQVTPECSEDDASTITMDPTEEFGKRPSNRDEYCKFCKSNRETSQIYRSHVLKNENGEVVCPILMKHICPICGKTGAEAHTIKYCPSRKDSEGGDASKNGHQRYRKVRNSVGRWCILKY